jgi:hypothetical protein
MALTVTGLLVFAFSIAIFVPSKSEASSESKKYHELTVADLPESPEGEIAPIQTLRSDIVGANFIVYSHKLDK